ncbi:MAG: LysM peptidoglycan-binding domain-containing protein [Gaiellaceae bacterium]
MARGWRAEVKRYGAPAAFLLAVTIAVLLVRSGLQQASAPPVTTTVRTTTTAPVKHGPRYYRLRAGETLSDVAVRFNTTVERLLALNPHVKPTALTVGERIRVR